MNFEYFFKYNAKFAIAIKKQFIKMKRFHNVRVNVKHSVINEFSDIIKLTNELLKKIIYCETRQVSLTN